jgi:AraC-like DNA-binding protein
MAEAQAVPLQKVPPWLEHTVSLRRAWSWGAMERSCFGPVDLDGPGLPFHHLGIVLDGGMRAGMRIDGRREDADMHPGAFTCIAAGDGGRFWWDRPAQMACFYFTDSALAGVLGLGAGAGNCPHTIRSAAARTSPVVVTLLRALHEDAAAGSPHGGMPGDGLFAALAAQLVPAGALAHDALVATVTDRRVRRALEYIHVHLHGQMRVQDIADAAASSPFHLARCFRAALGCSLWHYVLRERARAAVVLMRRPALSLAQVSAACGFDTYASFVTAVRREFGVAPASIRAALV